MKKIMNIEKIKIIGFDADDTLWQNVDFYRETENKFSDILKNYLPKEQVIKKLFDVEMKNLALYGYGAKSFMLSMIEAAVEISQKNLSLFCINEIIILGKKLIDQPIILLESVEKVIKILYPKYKLILATKGDLLDQERKLNKSGLIKYFHHIEVMSDKQRENYQKLISHLEIEPEEFLMIGNSVKSDVQPLVEIGSNAIHVPYKTTWEHEIVKEELNSENCMKVEHLVEVLNFL